jgi:hypothetical protein
VKTKNKEIDQPEPIVGKPSWSFRAQLIASILLLVHLAAIVAEPFHFFSRTPVRPSAADARWLRQTLAPYVDFMYLSHGYFFFAPNPGPNHIIHCQITPKPPFASTSGSREISVQYPDRKEQKPRLLYHRHFMLSEFYNTLFTPPELPPDARQNSIAQSQWQADRDRYVRLQQDIKNNLLQKFPNHEIQLDRIEHYQPSEYQYFAERWKLTDHRLYVLLPESLEGEPVQNDRPAQDGIPSTNTQNSSLPVADPTQTDSGLIPLNQPLPK